MNTSSIAPDSNFDNTLINYSEKDIDWQLAYRSHYNTSHTPEKRADGVIKNYLVEMQAIAQEFESYATGENREQMMADLEQFRQGYIKRLEAFHQAHSRVISVLVTGPANFPARRNEKANNTADKRRGEWLEWADKTLGRLRRQYDPRRLANAPIRSDDNQAIEKLQAKIDEAERRQELMKAANKIIRRKISDEQKVTMLVTELGFSEQYAWSVLKPDYIGRKGFASYELTNNSANIRRMKQRIESLKAEQERPPAEDKQIDDGLIVIENTEQNRIQLIFDDKPPAEVRNKLKSLGFRWSPRNTAWQRHLNDNGRRAVEMFAEWYKENK